MNEETARNRGERPNKSALKRQLAARARLLERALTLKRHELERLGLAETGIAALEEARALPPSGARKRQLKFCLRRFDDADFERLERHFDARNAGPGEAELAFRRLERWRERLIEQGDTALGEAIETWPGLDRQHLRRLVREARREREQARQPARAARRLFAYLRELSGL